MPPPPPSFPMDGKWVAFARSPSCQRLAAGAQQPGLLRLLCSLMIFVPSEQASLNYSAASLCSSQAKPPRPNHPGLGLNLI